MRTLASTALLVAGALLVVTGVLTAPPPRIATEPARIVRLHPSSALVAFPDGSFTTVPRSALAEGADTGDLIDLRVEPLGDTRFAAADPVRSGAVPAAFIHP